MINNKSFTILLACCSSLLVSNAQHITVYNPLSFERTEIISIPFQDFTTNFNVDSVFSIYQNETDNIIPHQIEKLGDTKPKNVLLQVKIKPKSKIVLNVKSTIQTSVNKTFARQVPERFQDFAWENDVVAFRFYGKALEGKPDDAHGLDFWAKRTENLIIDKWYAKGDYHRDYGEGLDYYSVGKTLGAGDIGAFFDNDVQYTKHYRTYTILDAGPIRTTFKLTYDKDIINNQKITVEKTVSLDAGEQFNKITVDVINEQNDQTPMVIGLSRRSEDQPQVSYDSRKGWLSYWEPDINNHGHTGTALISNSKNARFILDRKEQYLIPLTSRNGQSLTYYNGAAWDHAGLITNAESWKTYVEQKALRLKQPLKVKLVSR
ncbi:DUF4861 family protein [Sphingobacterium sp. LRF_L2]|uniref:DUF4861 family protein n=1 Tax=Sphingobacterium sp. LRF_L2 TaxID=3369421 RepID=UPI003F642592